MTNTYRLNTKKYEFEIIGVISTTIADQSASGAGLYQQSTVVPHNFGFSPKTLGYTGGSLMPYIQLGYNSVFYILSINVLASDDNITILSSLVLNGAISFSGGGGAVDIYIIREHPSS